MGIDLTTAFYNSSGLCLVFPFLGHEVPGIGKDMGKF